MNRSDELSPFMLGLCAGMVLAVLTFFWGQRVGSRDVQLQAGADRHVAVNLCRQQDAVAILITGETAAADRWECTAGSSRLLKRSAPLAPPLASPLARQ